MPLSLPAATVPSQRHYAQGAFNLMWIESHPELANHPKLIHLSNLLKISRREALGLVHEFWYWCTSYAEDGDLRKYGLTRVNEILQLDLKDNSLLIAGFIDRRPFLRVHDWWDYYGRYLKLKYRNNSKKLIQIESVCTARQQSRSSHALDTLKRTYGRTDVRDVRDVTNGRTDVPAETEISKNGGGEKKSTPHPKNCTCDTCWPKVIRGA